MSEALDSRNGSSNLTSGTMENGNSGKVNGVSESYSNHHKSEHKDKHRDKDRHRSDKDKHRHSSSKSSHKDKDRDREREKDKDKNREHKSHHSSSSRDKDKEHSSSRDKSKDHSSSSKDKHHSSSSRDKEKDREKDKHKHSSSSSSNRHSSSSKDKDKDKHREKSSHSSHRDEHKSKDREHKREHEEKDRREEKKKIKEEIVEQPAVAVKCEPESIKEEEPSADESLHIDEDEAEVKQEPKEEAEEEEEGSEDETPLALRGSKREAEEEDDEEDTPLFARVKKMKGSDSEEDYKPKISSRTQKIVALARRDSERHSTEAIIPDGNCSDDDHIVEEEEKEKEFESKVLDVDLIEAFENCSEVSVKLDIGISDNDDELIKLFTDEEDIARNCGFSENEQGQAAEFSKKRRTDKKKRKIGTESIIHQRKNITRRKKNIIKSKEKKQFKFNDAQFWHEVVVSDEENGDSAPDDLLSPYEYFSLFFTEELLEIIVVQTNLYSFQMTGKSLNFSKEDIKDFLGIQLMMGIVNMPSYVDYWSNDLIYEKVANVMPLKKYQSIRRYIHFADNSLTTDDRYGKIRPVLDIIRSNCIKLEQEKNHCIDEMMIPYKSRKGGSRRQYIKSKTKKWGFKMFVRAGVSGMVYDFLIYGGPDTFRQYPSTESEYGFGAQVVLSLCQSIDNPSLNTVYFDNYFTSMNLLYKLRNEYGILALGTLRQNRLKGAELPKKMERGESFQRADNDNKLVIVKWKDNNDVYLASNFVGKYPEEEIMRYNKHEKKKTAIACPKVVKVYNKHMGGVDLADMLVALYRTPLLSKRWYLAIFGQLLDICINNGWLRYKKDMLLLGFDKPMTLKVFRSTVATSLLRLGRTSKTEEKPEVVIIRHHSKPRPPSDICQDQMGHFPKFGERGRCRYCRSGQTNVICTKCNLRLCLVPQRNCFSNFHTNKH